jgi:hypothetical protein
MDLIQRSIITWLKKRTAQKPLLPLMLYDVPISFVFNAAHNEYSNVRDYTAEYHKQITTTSILKDTTLR